MTHLEVAKKGIVLNRGQMDRNTEIFMAALNKKTTIGVTYMTRAMPRSGKNTKGKRAKDNGKHGLKLKGRGRNNQNLRNKSGRYRKS